MEFDFIAYMRTVASTHYLVKNSESNKRFYIISSVNQLEELISNPRTKYPVICASDDDSARVFDNSADHVWERKPFSFYVLSNFKNISDVAERNIQKKVCKQIGIDVVSKLMKDRKNDLFGKLPATGLRNLDVSSFTYFAIGPLLDNVIGYEFFFSLEQKMNLKFNQNNWTL